MNKEIEAAIKALTARVNTDVKSDDALKFTQAALNLAHVASVLKHTEAL